MEIQTHTNDKLTIHRVSGSVEANSLIEFLQRNTGRWTDHSIIWNLNEASLSKLSADDVERFVVESGQFVLARAGRKTALVSRVSLHSGIFSLVEVQSRRKGVPILIRSFETEKEAINWFETD